MILESTWIGVKKRPEGWISALCGRASGRMYKYLDRTTQKRHSFNKLDARWKVEQRRGHTFHGMPGTASNEPRTNSGLVRNAKAGHVGW